MFFYHIEFIYWKDSKKYVILLNQELDIIVVVHVYEEKSFIPKSFCTKSQLAAIENGTAFLLNWNVMCLLP